MADRPIQSEDDPMPSAELSTLHAWIEKQIERGRWPGASYAFGAAGRDPVVSGQAGLLQSAPARREQVADPIYDLASLTKPLVAAAIALRLADAGHLDLDRPLHRVLPELNDRRVTMNDLLLHRAGFVGWHPIYRWTTERAAIIDVIAATPREHGFRDKAVYSCLSYIVAGIVLERIAGRPLDALFEQEVLAPLELTTADLCFGPLDESLRARCAATETGRVREASMAGDGELGVGLVPGPARPLLGVVHDGNAALLSGVSANAGLFGTARAVFRVASAMAVPGAFLSERAVMRVMTPWFGVEGEARTVGFQSGFTKNAPRGRYDERSFGHVGFTGTSVWIGGDQPLVSVLLTNRVHPAWTEAPMQTWRAEFHSLALDTHEADA